MARCGYGTPTAGGLSRILYTANLKIDLKKGTVFGGFDGPGWINDYRARISTEPLRIVDLHKDGLLAVFKASIDASMTSPDDGFTAVGGYVGTSEEWERVEAAWVKALAHWGLPYFHMKELSHRLRHEKDHCLEYFANILRDSDLFLCVGLALDADWKIRQEFVGAKNPLSDQYEHSLRAALSLVASISEERGNEEVAVLSDRDRSERFLRAVFDDEAGKRQVPTTLSVGCFKKLIPLQCADLAVGWLRREWLKLYLAGWKGDLRGDLLRNLPCASGRSKVYVCAICRPADAIKITAMGFGLPVWTINYRDPEGRSCSILDTSLSGYSALMPTPSIK